MFTKLLSREGKNDRNGSRPALILDITDSVVIKMVQYFLRHLTTNRRHYTKTADIISFVK